MLSGQRASRLLAVWGALVAVSCSSGPPTQPAPVTPTPTPAPTVAACTASAPQPMTSFTADPGTITDGDSFTLRWAAPCGFVSLAQKGKGPFITLLPSTGSYALRPGLDGYPAATGNTVYEARNADTATPREATVTMNPAPTPTPPPTPPPPPTAPPTVSLLAMSGTTCHPQKLNGVVTPCHVSFSASGTGYTSLAWSACCAGSTGTTGSCLVDALTGFTCTVTASGPGGTVSTAALASGVNSPPSVGAVTYSPPEPLLENNYITATPNTHDPDGDAVNCASVSTSSASCYKEGCDSSGVVVLHTTTAPGTCNWQATWVDGWEASTTQAYSVLVQ